MPQTDLLIDALKRALRAHRMTYRDVARALDLSEASVKRLFSDKSLSLQRLDSICAMMDIEISDLVRSMNERSQGLTRLTQVQEREIAGDIDLVLVTVCVLNRWTMADILAHFDISEHQCIRYLAKLDRLNIIELLPRNHIKLRVSPNFAWRPNGPIQQFFQARVKEDFFRSRFDKANEQLLVFNGMLSQVSAAVVQRRLQKLVRELDELNNADAGLPIDERNGATVVLAMRPWGYGVFADKLNN